MIGKSTERAETPVDVDLGAIFEAVDEAVVAYDRESGRVVEANPQFCELLGYERKTVLDARVGDMGADGSDGTFETEREQFRWTARDADGERVPVNVAVRPAGEGVSVATVRERRDEARTATDRRERRRYRRRLEERNRQLTVLNRIVRHDIRNDMAVVSGWAEELALRLDGEDAEMASRIYDSSTHVIGITRTVRDLTEMLDDDDLPELSAVNLRETLTAELERRDATFPDATFSMEELPAVDVRANELLASVFRNLLNNAVQHNDRQRPRVEVTAETGEGSVTVSVADDGPGIPEDKREAIFGRAEAGLDHHSAGVGLYLVDRLVEQYGGEVWAENRDTRGAVFRVRLPTVD